MTGRTREIGSGQKLKRIGPTDRRNIQLAVSRNRRWRNWEDARRRVAALPGACTKCGRESCGALWPEARCCEQCTHEEMPGWTCTHVLWLTNKSFFVMEHLKSRRREFSVYYRADGVIQWVREGPAHYFLGQRVNSNEFARFLAKEPVATPEAEPGPLGSDEPVETDGIE